MAWKFIRTIYFGIFTVQFNTNDIIEHVQCTVELAVITSHRHNTPASTHHYSYNKKLQALWECVDLLTVLMPHGAPSYLVRGSYALNGTTYFPEMYPGILHGNQAGKLLVAY